MLHSFVFLFESTANNTRTAIVEYWFVDPSDVSVP